MSALPSLTILSEEQKFNGDNLLQWKNNITQLLGAKGLMGYINGKIPKPSQSSTSDKDTPITSTPIYSTTPTLDEWNFRDQLTRGHITLNCTDVASLGVIITGTAKEAWDSIENEWGKSTDMRRSHAQEALNRTEYTEGNDIQDHIKLLRTRKAAVDNLSTSAMSDEAWRGVIIRSIPPTPKWLPVIPSLYSMATAADIVSTLLAHGMILGRGPTMNSSSTALAAHTNNLERCKNPNCKAKDQSTHKTEDCYWPGGGKEGQFPANFGQRYKANVTISDSPSQQTEHFVLSARVLETPGQSGILFDEPDSNVSSVGEQIPTPLDQTNVTVFELDFESTITDRIITQDETDTTTTSFTLTNNLNQLASANRLVGTTDIAGINNHITDINIANINITDINANRLVGTTDIADINNHITDINITDINNRLASTNRPLKTLGLVGPNPTVTGYANNMNPFTTSITPLALASDKPGILLVDIPSTVVKLNSDPANRYDSDPVDQIDQRKISSTKSIIDCTKAGHQFQVPQSYQRAVLLEPTDDIFGGVQETENVGESQGDKVFTWNTGPAGPTPTGHKRPTTTTTTSAAINLESQVRPRPRDDHFQLFFDSLHSFSNTTTPTLEP